MIRRRRLKKTLIAILAAIIATPALAGLMIYSWEATDGSSGSIEFSSDFVVGTLQTFDAEADVVDFSFTTPGSETYDSAFAFDALSGVTVGGDYLTDGIKRVLKKARTIGFRNRAVKRRPSDTYDWVAIDTDLNSETGSGRWALAVSVPEPSSMMLMFVGLGMIGFVRKRLAKR